MSVWRFLSIYLEASSADALVRCLDNVLTCYGAAINYPGSDAVHLVDFDGATILATRADLSARLNSSTDVNFLCWDMDRGDVYTVARFVNGHPILEFSLSGGMTVEFNRLNDCVMLVARRGIAQGTVIAAIADFEDTERTWDALILGTAPIKQFPSLMVIGSKESGRLRPSRRLKVINEDECIIIRKE